MKPTFRKRIFAWGMIHADEINHKIYGEIKKDLFKDIAGQVVEIGPGSGINFRYLPKGTTWKGIEPNEAFHHTLQAHAADHGIMANLVPETASDIVLGDESADFVLSTLVLCSVHCPRRALAEIIRVLKPGGKLLFIEHVAAPRKSGLRIAQNLVNPFNRFVADGCNCNRETWKYLETAGFSHLALDHYRMKGSLRIHAPHIIGYAVK